ncbi:AI-2E family transporter [Pelagicoccus albus]|uniref:AI-2E family transporter n=1 Tax=Pelagicoccus albus TaxID=415222 RepID=A0A7X1B7K1_9BACT|nr:AI-2E family transporter [Pelagicoccus albus]MBC2607136.1 AI-2E family transporter [Pelagicoccus albus]
MKPTHPDQGRSQANSPLSVPLPQPHASQWVVFSIIIFVTLYVARGFLLPVFSSLLLAYALIPFVRILTRLKIPRVIAAFLVVGLFTASFTYGIYALSTPAIEWLEKAPQSFDRVERLLESIKRPVDNVNAASERLNQMAQGEDGGREVVVRMKESDFINVVLNQTPIVIGAVISTLIFLFFLLAYGDLLMRRVVEISPRLRDKIKAVDAAREVETSVSKYLVTVSLINVALGLCVGISLFALGFENPILWGALATMFNFIPYLGAIAGVGLLGLASFTVNSDPQVALVYPGVYLLLTVLEGHFITPMILGRSFMINPIFIILVLVFLGWMWGVVGAVMAVPLLVAAKAAAAHFESTRQLATLLSR